MSFRVGIDKDDLLAHLHAFSDNGKAQSAETDTFTPNKNKTHKNTKIPA